MTLRFNLAELCDGGLIHSSWAIALQPVQPQLDGLANFLEHERASGHRVIPDSGNIMRAFRMPVESVRVLIVGQDPYPTPGHAIGRAFAVDPGVRPLPRSLVNIFTELESDTGKTSPATGDLQGWADQGVMLLNRVLTVRAGEAGSHANKGWEFVTERAIRVLAERNPSFVAILWGKQAATLRPLLGATPVVESAHPSPLSARRGFFGSRPFSRTNAFLSLRGSHPIDWSRDGGSESEDSESLS
jgi:uracil-DNA glycosylase